MKILKLLGLAAIVGGVTAVAIYKLREKKLHECEEQTIVICKCEPDNCADNCVDDCKLDPEKMQAFEEIKEETKEEA